MKRSFILSACLIILSLGSSIAQTNSSKTSPANPDQLFQTIAALDKELFGAIDSCDMDTFGAMWAENAEFYHDKNGLMIGRKNIVDAVKNNLCGKVKRELVPGTLEVYPMEGYGAVEIGVHRFLHPWEKDHGVVGEAKFIHLWQHQDGKWQITRVISFDHGPAK